MNLLVESHRPSRSNTKDWLEALHQLQLNTPPYYFAVDGWLMTPTPPKLVGRSTTKRLSAKATCRTSIYKIFTMASIIRKIVHTAAAPIAIGPYSQAVRVNDTLYISGQLGVDPTTNEAAPGGVEAECRQALLNIGNILKAAGGDFKNGEERE
uniref:Endoribonuclease L-PSP n=1 Tax=Romanomermis culicivorax TaxID=13658 RepID=A0A915K681_ROMCU